MSPPRLERESFDTAIRYQSDYLYTNGITATVLGYPAIWTLDNSARYAKLFICVYIDIRIIKQSRLGISAHAFLPISLSKRPQLSSYGID